MNCTPPRKALALDARTISLRYCEHDNHRVQYNLCSRGSPVACPAYPRRARFYRTSTGVTSRLPRQPSRGAYGFIHGFAVASDSGFRRTSMLNACIDTTLLPAFRLALMSVGIRLELRCVHRLRAPCLPRPGVRCSRTAGVTSCFLGIHIGQPYGEFRGFRKPRYDHWKMLPMRRAIPDRTRSLCPSGREWSRGIATSRPWPRHGIACPTAFSRARAFKIYSLLHAVYLAAVRRLVYRQRSSLFQQKDSPCA